MLRRVSAVVSTQRPIWRRDVARGKTAVRLLENRKEVVEASLLETTQTIESQKSTLGELILQASKLKRELGPERLSLPNKSMDFLNVSIDTTKKISESRALRLPLIQTSRNPQTPELLFQKSKTPRTRLLRGIHEPSRRGRH
jgi:hypothetical protein